MTERLTHCAGCQRELRGQDESAEDRPGTARRATKTLCGQCYTRQQRHGDISIGDTRQTGWGNCVHCNRAMRPPHFKSADYPGTIAHGGFGYCNSCTSRKKRLGDYGDPNAKRPVTEHQQAVIDLEATGAEATAAYMRARRRRIARTKRLAAIQAKYGRAA